MENTNNELETTIKNVIVYQTGVQITKVGEINLEQGDQLINISNLPESLDKESIRVKGIGHGKIVNINVQFNSKTEYRLDEHKKLIEEKESLEKKIKKFQKKLERANEQTQKFKSTENTFHMLWAKAFAFGEVNSSKLSNFNDKIDEYINSTIDNIDLFEEKLKELRKEHQVILNKISKLGSIEKVHNFYEISINLNVTKVDKFRIEIKYTMKQAWWMPFYDVSLSENKARLTMMANVYNRTGEDWENINIEISTASLKPIRLMKPHPTILQEYIPAVYSRRDSTGRRGIGFGGAPPGPMKSKPSTITTGAYDKPTELDALEREISGLVEEQKPVIEETYAEVSENIGVQSFKIPNKISIPSDENPHPVNLNIDELETEKKYYWSNTTPETVIIQDTLINGDLLLLAGNVKIYYLEEFLGETEIPLVAPKERFKLGTRVSYNLKVDKKIIDRSKDKKAVKGRLKNNYEYKINIKNLSGATEQLTIYDRIPHSSSENIKVEIETISPEPDKKELGILKWIIKLNGVKETNIHYKYFVDYKKGITITPSLP